MAASLLDRSIIVAPEVMLNDLALGHVGSAVERQRCVSVLALLFAKLGQCAEVGAASFEQLVHRTCQNARAIQVKQLAGTAYLRTQESTVLGPELKQRVYAGHFGAQSIATFVFSCSPLDGNE